MSTTVDVGVDLGTTVTKAVALDGARRVVARASLPTPWERPRAEWCERDPADAVATVDRLLANLVRLAGDVHVRSIGFCSIAETGSLVDAGGSPVSRLLAWHDPRGGRQAATLDPALAAVLPSRTGLAVSAVATFFKLLWWRDEAGLDLAGLQWLGLPELLCHGLGTGRFAERSMLGRTALWDIHDEDLFEPALDTLGVGPDLVPPRVAAGAALGRVRSDHPVAQARGAVLTVAGHDHLVAAAALGAGGIGSLCDSMGTAEALIVAVAVPPAPRVVAGLVTRGLSVYPHVVDSTTCLLGALRSGLVLGRALDELGMTTLEQRLAFDAGMPAGTEPADVTVEGLEMSDDHVTVAWPDGTDPYAALGGRARPRPRGRRVGGGRDPGGRRAGRRGGAHRWLGQPALGGRQPARHRRAHAARHARGTGCDRSGTAGAVGGHPASGGIGPDHARGATARLVHRPVGLELLPMTDTVARPEDEVVRICQELIRIDTEQLRGRQRPRRGGGRGSTSSACCGRSAWSRRPSRATPGGSASPCGCPAPTATGARCACTGTSTSCRRTPPTGRSTRSRARSATAASGAVGRST